MHATKFEELRNEPNIFSVDRGINQKKDGQLNQCAQRIIANCFRPFLVDTSINRKNILDLFLII